MYIYERYDYSHEFSESFECFIIKFKLRGNKKFSKLIFNPIKVKSIFPK